MPAETVADQGQPLTDEQMSAAWAEELAARQAPSQEAATATSTAEALEETQETADAAAAVATAAAPAQEDPRDKRLETLEKLLTKMQTEQGRTNGRVAALQSTVATGKAAAASTTGGPSDAQIEAAIEDPAEWKQLMEDFPDWGVAFEKKMDAKIAAAMKARPAAAPATAVAPAGAADPNAEFEQRVQKELATREVARVDRKHPKWRETVKTPDFQEWKANQAAEVQALYGSDSSDDAIEMLSLYEGSKTQARTTAVTTRRKDTLASAATTGKPRQQTAPGALSEADMTPKQLWELEKRQRQQRRAA